MRSLFLIATATIFTAGLWAAFIFMGTINGWWRAPLAGNGDTDAFMEAMKGRIENDYKGNVAFRLVENGLVHDELYASVGTPVDGDTQFQVASLSKWISAWGVMALVDEGKLDLDAPVTIYLTRWSLPESEFDNAGVTIRRLLSHTAGLTDGLGYGGFAPGAEPQSLEESLTHASDASPGADGRVRVGEAPGAGFSYSGGGYTLLQLVVEETSGMDFEAYMQETVFAPLGMNRSTFVMDGKEVSNLATFHDVDGTEATHFRFSGLAPTSLYTSASDMTRFIQAHFPGPKGEPIGRGVLKPETIEAMRQPHASQMGADIWGLGTMLYAPNGADDYVIGHDGNNDPAINTAVRLNPATGDGIVLLETGNRLLATTLAGEWVFWQTGTMDILEFTIAANDVFTTIAIGWAAILVIAVAVGWRMRRGRVGAS